MMTNGASPTIPLAGRSVVQAAPTTVDRVWHDVARSSFAVIGYVTPNGEPRSTGVVYGTSSHHLYTAVAPDSWKAKHIAASGRVSVTVPVRRGGLLALIAPIPPATISFHGAATVHPPGWKPDPELEKKLTPLLPPERRGTACIVEIVPEGDFLTFGIGVPLRAMLSPAKARGRVPV